MQSKEAKEKVDLVVAKWMIDASIPFNAANSAYYQTMFDATCSFGAGYKAPNFYDLCGYLLTKNVKQVKNFVNSFRTTWKETGCTIMADGWTDQQRRTLINFLVYCPRGTIFLKSDDASDASKTAKMLYKLFREVVLFVGVENVVHFITDNVANYVATGRLLEREFPTLYWSPCAAHCLNLMLHDMDKLDEKECAAIVQLTEPLVRVLRIVDSDERPAMGYLWDSQFHKNLHAAGYWLNPAYQYNSLDLEKHRHATSGLLDMIERYSYANANLMSNLTGEMRLFRKAEGDFGRVSAIRDCDVMLPDEWWTCYGSTTPNLQKLAIHVLSQTCSAFGSERNWSLFEHIHSKKRNRLEHQKLNDLVYVHYNLRLQQR
ncbi:uncharacterized protein LOC113780467 [Coffea eugenioides]|uniref:uncharacterized protein LOC113780467 n=1 Tax=Coffea eugenioides TaxID=49369 RepID=UPI000F60D9E7|nr:uncharacterized protein LOC113780467 [Coffea eugenioides]